MLKTLLGALGCWLLVQAAAASSPVSYDIVYVRAPRSGATNYVRLPDVFYPTAMPAGSDLMLLHPDGTEEVLFAAGNGAVLDPAVSFDAQWVFFSYIPDATSNGINPQRGLAYGGADIYKINVATRQVVRLTQQVWTPPTGSANWSANPLSASAPNTVYLGFGIFNMAPCPLPGGKVMFVSSRDGYLPNKEYTSVNLRLYIMDDTGLNQEPVGHLNIGSALHPTVLMDGRVMFASFEAQGVRDQRNWSLWAIGPDGRHWEPLISAMSEAPAFHFQTQLSDGRIAVSWYYNLNDNGFGTILAFNSQKPAGSIPFGSPNAGDSSNPSVRIGLWPPNTGTPLQPRYTSFPFSPPGLVNLTGFSHGMDGVASYAQNGGYAGKATHPAAAPNDDMLLTWTPGPANNSATPLYDAGIYLLPGGQQLTDYRQLVLIKNDPNYNEIEPKALVPYSAIYGIPQPAALPFLPNDGSLSTLLPPGTPFGLIGTSSFYNRNTTPGYGISQYNGLDPFNTSENGASSNWVWQGADAGLYTSDDIYAVRILALEGVANRSYPNGGDPGFINFADKERIRILGEIPLRKTGPTGSPVLDAQGNPDTSFLARVPADTPISFQTLDKNGLVLNMAQTWHMVRPGEVRTDCGGCHAHNKVPLDFSGTAASQGSYQAADLTSHAPLLTRDSSGNTVVKNAAGAVVDVEYYRDIKPILQRSCVPCHSKNGNAAAGLVLDDTALVNGYENTYNRLANDSNAQWGYNPVIANGQWRQTNASRYIRMFQSRRSLLVWKIFGQRLDGWTNGSHPTESSPGNAATLPAGADPDVADIDYTGAQMPPPNAGVPPLSADDMMTIARWIDLGAPITEQGDPSYKGYFADEIKPTLTVSAPRSGSNGAPLTAIRIGMFDAYSGINATSLSVVANFAVNGQAPGTELGPLFTEVDSSIWQLSIAPITNLASGRLVVSVKDNAGNITTVDRWFSIGAGTTPPQPPPPPSTWSIMGSVGSGASVSLTGAATATTAADASGNYTFSGLANGAYTVTPSRTGYTFTPASQNVTINGADVTGVNFTAQAVPPPPPPSSNSISIDAQVSRDQGTASATVKAPAISTKANDLLLAFISTDYVSGANTTVKSVTGGGLTWTRVARANAQSGTSEIWRAAAVSPLANATVTATLSQAVVSSLTVIAFSGASTTGAAAAAGSGSGAPSVTLVTTQNNSWIFAVGNDYDNAIARTPLAGQSLVHQDLAPVGDTYWVQMQNAPVPLSGTSTTVGDSAPVTDRFNLAAVEIVPGVLKP
jgi:hypothetical protein